MDAKVELRRIRTEIDEIDSKILELFEKRMQTSELVAKVKQEGNIGIKDTDRENEVIQKAVGKATEGIKSETKILFNTLMSLSKMKQRRILTGSPAINFPKAVNKKTTDLQIAFAGVKGAWAESAATILYPEADLKSYEYFEDVFIGVSKGEVDYGVVPIENSQSGAIGEVYDLLSRHGCYIVGTTWIEIKHCLMGMPGTKLHDIREVFSHAQGFTQCHNYLKNKPWDTTICRNTAVAAELVAEKGDKRLAAIASERATKVYGLEVLDSNIIDSHNNSTRFIAIAKMPEYDDNSKILSISFLTHHSSGALCSVLDQFMIMGMNLSRIESRPSGIGKYRFFVDLEANIDDENVIETLGQASMLCQYFEVLGCY